MDFHEHEQTAREFLAASDREFEAGDLLQASEKLWGAASHAVMAAALQREWPCNSHRAMNNAVQKIAQETGDNQLTLQFSVAEKFHINFYHNAVPDFQVENDRPTVHEFVDRMLSLVVNGAG